MLCLIQADTGELFEVTCSHPLLCPLQASGGEIVALDNRYEIISSTGSLIVHNSNQQPEMLHFYCTARNMFKTSVSNNITVEFFLVGKCSGVVVVMMNHSKDSFVRFHSIIALCYLVFPQLEGLWTSFAWNGIVIDRTLCYTIM